MATEFKSLADFKRRVTHMTLIRQANHKNGIQTDVPNWLIGQRRKVAKINSVDIVLETVKPDGQTVGSHLQLGKASEWTFDGATVTRDDGYGLMQYTVEAKDA